MADPSNGQSPAWPSEAATAADFAQEVPIWLKDATAAEFKGGDEAGRITTLSTKVLILEGSVSNLTVRSCPGCVDRAKRSCCLGLALAFWSVSLAFVRGPHGNVCVMF